VLPGLARLLSVKMDPEGEESSEGVADPSHALAHAYRAWVEAVSSTRVM
jgi:hypothetical protein